MSIQQVPYLHFHLHVIEPPKISYKYKINITTHQSFMFKPTDSYISATQPQTNNPRLLTDHISNIAERKCKEDVLNELARVDQQLYRIFQGTNGGVGEQRGIRQPMGESFIKSSYSSNQQFLRGTLASTFSNSQSIQLGIPKSNSLTDSFLRSTLGCQQKLAKSYMQIIDKSQRTQQQEKQQSNLQAKRRFAQSNSYKDTFANCKPFSDKIVTQTYLKKTQPVVDNEHQSYLKTQLIYMEKPLAGKKITEKEYYDKHTDSVAKKINEIGGMEDTVGCMEQSLARNEIRNFGKRSQFVGNNKDNPFKTNSRSITKKQQTNSGNSWVDRSKSIRQALKTKFDIN